MSTASESTLTYDLHLLEESAHKWRRSLPLRLVYGSIFRAISSRLGPGTTLELGSGIANSREFIPDIVTSDIVKTKYVDLACSAYEIPNGCPQLGIKYWNNIIAVDVLHHLCRPVDFIKSAAAVLPSGGTIILVEPAATSFGKVFYRAFHREPIEPKSIKPPFVYEPDSKGEFANMGMGMAMFVQWRKDIQTILDEASVLIKEISFRDIMAYPLSGGYSGRQLAPAWLIRLLLGIEAGLPQSCLSTLGLRMVIVLRKC